MPPRKTLCNLYIWSILGVSLFQGVVIKIPFDLVNLPFSHKGCPFWGQSHRNSGKNSCYIAGWSPYTLVVEPTHLKNISRIGSFPQVRVKIFDWNHHLVLLYLVPFCSQNPTDVANTERLVSEKGHVLTRRPAFNGIAPGNLVGGFSPCGKY